MSELSYIAYTPVSGAPSCFLHGHVVSLSLSLLKCAKREALIFFDFVFGRFEDAVNFAVASKRRRWAFEESGVMVPGGLKTARKQKRKQNPTLKDPSACMFHTPAAKELCCFAEITDPRCNRNRPSFSSPVATTSAILKKSREHAVGAGRSTRRIMDRWRYRLFCSVVRGPDLFPSFSSFCFLTAGMVGYSEAGLSQFL